ncbi:MAG: hypothetical protein HXS48_08430 [Theionarchaea archaeon]|nr:hypothetical protein [Theionarchaea archaeon]
MKSKNFKTWRGFIDSVDFEQIDARLIVYVITERIELQELETEFCHFLENHWKNMIVELIRNSFTMSYSTFESHYPEIVEILGLDRELLETSRNRITESWLRRESPPFDTFIGKCVEVGNEIRDKGRPTKETLQKLEKIQKGIEIDCLKDPTKGKELFWGFFGHRVDMASNNPERALFFDIKRRCPEKNILCLYLEQERRELNLYFYPSLIGEEEFKEEIEKPLEKLWVETPAIPRNVPTIPRCKIHFREARELYAPHSIEIIVNEHIMPALHPSPISIFFPSNNFMLEVDPEEPEIGFLSGRIDLGDFQTLEERLGIDFNLRKKLWIYKLKRKGEDRKSRFVKSRFEDKKDSQEESVLIIGRIENLFRIFFANRQYGLIYQSLNSTLRLLAFFITMFLAIRILQMLLLEFSEGVARAFWSITVLVLAILAFDVFKTFALNYLLEPFYGIVKWFSYISLAVILLFSTELLSNLGRFLFFLIPIVFLVPFSRYIRSAILYSLNNSFGIIGYRDIFGTGDSSIQNNIRTMEILKCGRFQTTVRNRDIKVFFNSNIFPKIRWIKKKPRTLPRKMAYSSAVFLSSEDVQKSTVLEDRCVEEVLYRRPKTTSSGKKVENFLFGKGEIVSREPESMFSSKNRYIFFGYWNYVIRRIGRAVPVFSQPMQSRIIGGTIILITLLGLFFNILKIYNMSIGGFINWMKYITIFDIIYYFFIPFIWIFLARALRFRSWKALLVLVFYFLLRFQPSFIAILVYPTILMSLVLFQFPINQALYFFGIWANEKLKGNIISVVKNDGQRGIIIEKNFLVTRLQMSDPTGFKEERIYFNKRFFNDIIKSAKWKEIRAYN